MLFYDQGGELAKGKFCPYCSFLLLKFISLTKNRREKERKTMTKLLCCLIMRREL